MAKANRALQLVGEAGESAADAERAEGAGTEDPTGDKAAAEGTAEEDTAAEDTGEAEAPPDDETAESEGRRTWTRRRVARWLARVGVVALVALSIAAAAVVGWKLKTQREITNAGQQALAAAQQYAVILTSVDSTKLDDNFNAVIGGATGEFKDMYTQSSAQLKQLLIDNKANSKGKVVAAGIKSATKDKVEVMMFVDQAVTNALNPTPRMDRSRIIVTMERVNGRWLASKVDLP